jgi:hypothetical protein
LTFNIEKKKILQESAIIEPPYREADPNPRGGFRGLKGISFYEGYVAIANASTIFLYDKNWNPLKYIWHPSCSGIHDIEFHNNRIWVTSSRNDLLFCFDLNGEISKYHDLRQHREITAFSKHPIRPFINKSNVFRGKINFRDPRTHDNVVTDMLHVNSLAFLNNGEVLISCGLLRVINNYSLHILNNQLKNSFFSCLLPIYQRLSNNAKSAHSTTKRFINSQSYSLILKMPRSGDWSSNLIISDCTVPSHSIRILRNNTAIYLNSTSGEIIHFDPYHQIILSSTKIGKTFLRGARELSDNTLLIGDNNEIIHFNLLNKQILSRTTISDSSSEAIFDINLLPDYFTLPPKSFPVWHKKLLPVNQINLSN